MPLRSARDFRNRYVQVSVGELLAANVWYRSPLWDHDHLLGEEKEWANDQISWCGRALDAARDWTDGEEWAGLWISERKSSRCPYCTRKQSEWDERFGT